MRFVEHNTLLKGGKLFQQFIVDAYSTIKEAKLRYIKDNQKSLRFEIYKGLIDAMYDGDTQVNLIGK